MANLNEKDKLYQSVIGPEKWNAFIGQVDEIPLPENWIEEFMKPSPFWPDKKVHETDWLVFVPATVEVGDPPMKVPLSIEKWEEILAKRQTGRLTKYEYIADLIPQEFKEIRVKASYWALLTKDVIPESRFKIYSEQKPLVLEKGYEVPDILTASIAIQLEYISTGNIYYRSGTQENPKLWTYTRCKEEGKEHDGWQAVVGGFGERGLRVIYYTYPSRRVGIAGMRKL